jgi:hypothetical protein
MCLLYLIYAVNHGFQFIYCEGHNNRVHTLRMQGGTLISETKHNQGVLNKKQIEQGFPAISKGTMNSLHGPTTDMFEGCYKNLYRTNSIQEKISNKRDTDITRST